MHPMIARDWILDTLAELELWYWPIFFWELYWLDRYLEARRAEHHSGLIGYGVTRQGRIHITLQAYGDEPNPNDWTAFAQRAPWTRLSLDSAEVLFVHLETSRTAPGAEHIGEMTVIGHAEAVTQPLAPP